MDYYDWRNAVFNQPIQTLEKADCESEAFALGLAEAFDHIDRALMDDGNPTTSTPAVVRICEQWIESWIV